MNDIERDLRRRLKKSICKRTELNNKILEYQREKKELIEYLKKEQDRLTRECSSIYEDGLGKTRLVNEEIYNEVSKILSKIEKR